MKNKVSLIAFGAAVIVGSLIGYKVATDADLRGRLAKLTKGAVDSSKKKFDGMSEDVALKTAKLTNNPKVNQNWVEKQWESIGL